MDVENHFGNFSRWERMNKGLSLKALGAIIGLGEKRVWEIEQMETPSIRGRTKIGLAAFWGVPVENFEATWRQPRPDTREPPAEIPAGIAPLSLDQPPRWDLDVRASTWAQFPLCELDADDPRQQSIIANGRFQLRILGTCMEPAFHDGQTVEFEMIRVADEGMVIGDCLAVCKCDGMATFKQLVRRDEHTIYLAAINQTEFPGEIPVPIQEIGRVARALSRMVPVKKIPVVKVNRSREGARN